MFMITGQELLSVQLSHLQHMQFILSRADTAAASHALKTRIQEQSVKLDQLETQMQIHFLQRGWDFYDADPLSKWIAGLRFRCRDDSAIAEHLIRLYSDRTIAMTRLRNQWKPDDRNAINLYQKFLDHCAVGIGQMQPFL